MRSDWDKVRLGNHCVKIGSGSTPTGGNSVYLENGNFTFVRSQNIYNDGFDYSGIVYLKDDDAEKLKNVAIERDDILLNITGDSVARVCSAPKDILPARVNQHVAIIRPDEDVFDKKFLRYYMSSVNMQNILLSLACSGGTRNALTKSMIENLQVSKPPMEVQKKIAYILSTLDDKIHLNTQINKTLETMAQALFKSWFVDFVPVKAKMEARAQGGDDEAVHQAAMSVISGKTADALAIMKETDTNAYSSLSENADLFPEKLVESELGLIPEGWEVQTIGNITEYPSERVSVSVLNLNNYISTENMLSNKGGITAASSLPTTTTTPLFENGHILVSNIRPYFQKIWLATFAGGRSNDVLGFVPKLKGISEFVYHLMYQDSFFAFMMTTSKGAKMPRGDKDAIMKYKLAFDIKAAAHFSIAVKEFNEIATEHVIENKTLAQTRDTLLPKLLSGEIELSTFGKPDVGLL